MLNVMPGVLTFRMRGIEYVSAELRYNTDTSLMPLIEALLAALIRI